MQKSRKPLVNWCRWNSASLRLAGHDEQAVWGELAYANDQAEPFRFNMHTWQLTRTTTTGDVTETLDETGIAHQSK